MQIPIHSVSTAASAATPLQAIRPHSGADRSSTANLTSTNTVERLNQSTETGDRDAQEQYQGPRTPPGDKEKKIGKEPETSSLDPAQTIWELEVCDDSPPADLDIRG